MPNWWLVWAEHVARALAEWWVRSRAAGGGRGSEDEGDAVRRDIPPPRHADSHEDGTD